MDTTYNTTLAVAVTSFVQEKYPTISFADSTGLEKTDCRSMGNKIGFLDSSFIIRKRHPWFFWKKAKKHFIGVLHIASNEWKFEAFGKEYMDKLEKIKHDLSSEFGKGISLTLVREGPWYEVTIDEMVDQYM